MSAIIPVNRSHATAVAEPVRDEIGEIVATCLSPIENSLRACELANRMLPAERGQEAWPMTVADQIDPQLAKQYPLLDLDSVMSSIHPRKYKDCPAPRFAMYKAFGKGKCKLSVIRETGDATAPAFWPQGSLERLKKAIAAAPKPEVEPAQRSTARDEFRLPWMWREMMGGATRTTLTLKARFTGHIPAEVRQKIHDARPHCDEVFLIQEVHEWSAEQTVERIDPLVVGIKNGVAYLIDRFDTTTFEEYVAREFSQGTV